MATFPASSCGPSLRRVVKLAAAPRPFPMTHERLRQSSSSTEHTYNHANTCSCTDNAPTPAIIATIGQNPPAVEDDSSGDSSVTPYADTSVFIFFSFQ